MVNGCTFVLSKRDNNLNLNIMKVAEFKNITKNKLNALSIEELKNTLLLMNDNFELAGEIIFNTALDLLESKMDENEFISFCDEL